MVRQVQLSSSVQEYAWSKSDLRNERLLIKRHPWSETREVLSVNSFTTECSIPITPSIVVQAQISPCGNFVVTAHRQETGPDTSATFNIWSIPSGKLVASVNDAFENEIWGSVDVSPLNGKYLLSISETNTGESTIRFWEIQYPDSKFSSLIN
jgi:hypothetical protein